MRGNRSTKCTYIYMYAYIYVFISDDFRSKQSTITLQYVSLLSLPRSLRLIRVMEARFCSSRFVRINIDHYSRTFMFPHTLNYSHQYGGIQKGMNKDERERANTF